MTALRILEVNKFYHPHVGGIERVVQDLAEGLLRRGHQVRVLACRSGPGRRHIAQVNGVPVIYAASFGVVASMPVSLDFFVLLRRLARWADIVHWHEPFPLASLGSLFLSRRAIRALTWHSDIVRQRFLKPLVSKVQDRSVANADLVIPTSERLAKNSPVLTRMTRPRHAIAIGIPLRRLLAIDPEWERRWLQSAAPRGRYCLFVGRFAYYKGLDILLQALARCSVRAVLIGRGPLSDWLASELASRNLRDRVALIERAVEDDELALFYKHCDFLVLPSTAPSEAFGIVQIEAMAHGKPVINTWLPTGVPEVSRHEVTGLTVPPGDPSALSASMERLWTDGELRSRLGRAAQQRAFADFDAERMVAQYHERFQLSVAGEESWHDIS